MATTQIRGANNGSGVSQIKTATISNADIHASAAIAYSKLNLTGSIVNADINASAAIASTKLATWSADRNAGTFKLTNLGDPTSAQDAATKYYVDSLSAGLDPKESCRLATTTTLDASAGASTYTIGSNTTGANNGVILYVTWTSGTIDPDAGQVIATSGGSATIVAVDAVTTTTSRIYVRNITGSALTTTFSSITGGAVVVINSIVAVDFITGDVVGAIAAIDGVTLTSNQRLLVKNESDAKQNGIYYQTVVGTGSLTFALRRSDDQDGTPSNEVSSGNFTFIEAGTANAGKGYVLTGDGTLTLNTDSLVWTQFSSTGGGVSSITTDSGTVTPSSGSITVTGGNGINSSGSGATLTLVADLKTNGGLVFESNQIAVDLSASSITGFLAVTDGGTGQTAALTTNGVVYAASTSAMATTAAGALGTIFLGTASAPAFTTNLKILTDNTITLDVNASTLTVTTSNATGVTSSAISIATGSGTGGGGQSGAVTLKSGNGFTAGISGAVSVTSGNTVSNNSGTTTVSSGTVTTAGDSGIVTVITGDSSTSGNTGELALATGDAAGGNSGNITITTGTASGTVGTIIFSIGGTPEADIAADGMNVVTGNSYQVNNVSVLNATTLGSSVVTSSLQAVGTLTSGTWNATVIGTLYGGTGLAITPSAIVDGDLLIGSNAGDAFVRSTLTAGTGITITNGAGSITISIDDAAIVTNSDFVTEQFSGNGSTTAFNLTTPAVAATDSIIHVYLNGIRQKPGGEDFTITDTDTVTFVSAPQTGDFITVDYIIA